MIWQTKARAFLEWSMAQLWSGAGHEVKEWLKGRGISEDTAKANLLGHNPKNLWLDRKDWGLPEELKENGKRKKLWLPSGLVIAKLRDDRVLRIRIRRENSEDGPRYYILPGSIMESLVIPGGKKGTVVVESELDALLINQEAGDLATTIALGSAQMRPDLEAVEVLKNSECILVSLDADKAGAKESWGWWRKNFKQAERWPPVSGKDPGDMWKAGVSIREWVLEFFGESDPVGEQSPEGDTPGVSLLAALEDDQGLEASTAVVQSLQTGLSSSNPSPGGDPRVATQTRANPNHEASEGGDDTRQSTVIMLQEFYAMIGSQHRKPHWQKLVSLPGWRDRYFELEDEFTRSWKRGSDCRAEFELLRDHWLEGLQVI